MTTSTRGFTFKPATIDDVPELTSQMLTRGLQDFERVGEHPILSLAPIFSMDLMGVFMVLMELRKITSFGYK
jgi:hypothetical protein